MDRRRALQLLTTPLFGLSAWRSLAAQAFSLPSAANSVKFAAIGDNGTGDKPQYDIANQMVRVRAQFPFDRAIMLGDNIYGGQSASDLVKKFSTPYKALLDGGVKFYASIGNHDDPAHINYPLWNMNGQRYYTYATRNVRFFALDSNYMDPKQIEWLDKELAASGSDWKIAFFHHPLYSSGRTHGSALESRAVLEPLFIKYGVSDLRLFYENDIRFLEQF